ncbi:MAG: histidine kinase [Verrucomicrobia bacterium]|nr:histidine kinase [Verrucomicrobiota bacterium]
MSSPSTAPAPAPRPAWYWTCQVAGWGIYAGVNFLLFRGHAPFLVAAALALIFSLEGLLLTHAYRHWIHRRGWRELPAGALLLRALPSLFALAALLVACVPLNVLLVRSLVGAQPRPEFDMLSPGALAGIFFNLSFLMALWSALYFGYHFVEARRRAEIDRWRLAAALSEAELRALRAQVNPHFLFNALNSLRSLINEDPARARESVTQLAAILRYSLESAAQPTVPLAAELRMVDDYLALEQSRFEDRLQVRREIEPAALALPVPPMLVQTLVENAVKYGVSRQPGPGFVALRVARERGRNELVLEVRNRGELAAAGDSTGLGLANARERLTRLFGPGASLQLAAQADEVSALVRIPLASAARANALTQALQPAA